MKTTLWLLVLSLFLLPLALPGCSTGGVSVGDTYFYEDEHLFDVHDSRPPGWWKEYEEKAVPETEVEVDVESVEQAEPE